MSAGADEREAGALVSAGAGGIVLLIAAAYFLARWGFETPLLPVARAAGLGLFLATGGELARGLARSRASQWFASEGWLGLCPLLLAALTGALLPGAWWLLVALGGASFVLALTRAWRGGDRRLVWLGAVSLMGCWFVGMAWGHGYANPLFVEGLATSALAKTTVDTLFHATIANMVELHGVASTGLDGVVPLSYHVASHWLLAWLSRLCGVPPFDFYQLGYPVAILPLLWASLLRLGLTLRDGGTDERLGWRFWALSVAGLVGVLPLESQRAFAIGWWRPVSESYGVSLILALSLLSALVACYRSLDGRALSGRDRSHLVFLLFVLPIGVAVTGLTKSSTAVTLLAGGAFALWRLRLLRERAWLAAALLSAGLTAFALSRVEIPGFARLRPFAFLRSFVHHDALPLWPAAYFLWLWVLVVQRVRALEPGMTLRAFIARLRAGELFDLQLVVVVAVVGSLPDAVLAIPGQSGGYFSDLHRWLALALLLAHFAQPEAALPERQLGERRLSALGIGLIYVALAGVVLVNSALLLQRVAKTNLAVRRALLPGASLRQLLGRSGALQRAALAQPNLQLFRVARSAAAQPRAARLAMGLVAPEAPEALKKTFNACELPFVWTGLSGLPLVGGLPEKQCQYFGYWSYQRRRGGWGGPGQGLSGCERGERLGLTTLARVRNDAQGVRLELEACDKR